MTEAALTEKQILKQLSIKDKETQDLRSQLNKIAQKEINNKIDGVKQSLDTLKADDDFDMTDVRKRLKKLLGVAYPSDYQVKVTKKAASVPFEFTDLAKKLKADGVTTKANAKGKKELESIYFDGKKLKFNQKWNDQEERDKHLKSDGELGAAVYWAK